MLAPAADSVVAETATAAGAEAAPTPPRPAKLVVCVCTADRAAGLARLLETLAGCELSLAGAVTTEILVVDNRPGGAAREVVEAAAKCRRLATGIVEERRPGIPFARNRAVREALRRGADWVAFLDDDDQPRPDWLARLLERQRASGAELVFGASHPDPALALPFWASHVPYLRPTVLDALNVYGLPAGASTANVLIARAALEALGAEGPFRDAFAGSGGEDTDLFVRAARAGFRYAVAEDSVVVRRWPSDRLTYRGLWRRAIKYGQTRHLLRRLNPIDGAPGPTRGRILQRAAERLLDCVPALFRPHRLVQRSLRFAEQCGEVAAAFGRSGGYYLSGDAARRP